MECAAVASRTACASTDDADAPGVRSCARPAQAVQTITTSAIGRVVREERRGPPVRGERIGNLTGYAKVLCPPHTPVKDLVDRHDAMKGSGGSESVGGQEVLQSPTIHDDYETTDKMTIKTTVEPAGK